MGYSRTYTLVVKTAELVKVAEDNRLHAVKLPADNEMAPPYEGLVIVLAEENAQEVAKSVTQGGVDETKVEWINGADFEGGVKGLLIAGRDHIMSEKRDLHFGQIRSLYDAEIDPAMQERIPAGPDWAARNIIFRRRELIVVAGAYGCGKSTINHYLGMHWCLGEGAKYEKGHEKEGQRREKPVWLCTWEDDPFEQKEQVLRFMTQGRGLEANAQQIEDAEKMQRAILHTRPEADISRDFEWFTNAARYMNKKYGTNFFVCDPWSEFEHLMNKGENETQYVNKIMHELTKLSTDLNAIIIVTTHITKSKYSDDMGIKPFRVADAMGSVQFGSKAARGICVARVSTLSGIRDHTVLYFDKVKISNGANTMGKDREAVALSFDELSHTFIQDLDATMDAAGAWGCGGGGKMNGDRPGNGEKTNNNNNNVVDIDITHFTRGDT